MRKFKQGLFLFAVGGVLCFPNAFAESVPEWNLPYERIFDIWEVRREVIAVNPNSLGTKELDQIQALKKQFGVTSLPLLSMALLKETKDRNYIGTPTGEQLLTYASEFSPNLTAIDFFACSHKQAKDGWVGSFKQCARGLHEMALQNEGRIHLLTNAFFVLASVWVLVLIFFIVYLAISYAHPIAHHWAHRLRGTRPLGILLLALGFLLLAWISFGWIGLVLLFFVFVWSYIRFPEKVLGTLLLLTCAALPLALYAPAQQYEYEQGILHALEEPLQGPFLADTGHRLDQWLAENPKDADAAFVLALIERHTGRIDRARDLLQKASTLRPGWHKPIVNLAVMDYIAGDSDSAISRLKKATSLAPSAIIPHFNLGKIFYKQARLDEGLASLRKAKEIDAEKFAYLDKASNPNDVQQFIFDESFSREEIAQKIWTLSPSLVRTRNAMFQSIFPRFSVSTYWMFMGAIFFLMVVGSRFVAPARLPRRCQKCGLPSCAVCDPLVEHESLCTQCFHMFVRLESAEPEARQRKQKMISRFAFLRDIQERWIAFIFPGIHSFFRGDFFRALFFSAAGALALILMMKKSFLLTGRYVLPDVSSFPIFPVAICFFVIIYLLSLLDAVRR